MNRVKIHGWTWYRGRLISNTDPQIIAPPRAQRSHNTAPPHTIRRERFSCFTWNVGGLSGYLWDSFQAWLTGQNLDIVMLQETHWSNSLEWQQDKYLCIHSSCGNKQGGVLCMIAKKLCNSDALSWTELIPGRLLHIRLHGPDSSIDVVNVYQRIGTNKFLDERATLWNKLQSTLQSLPKRNILVLGGDFNSSLTRRSASVGIGTFVHRNRRITGSTHTDDDAFHELLKTCQLDALNTWTNNTGATYHNDVHGSRIDFLCCKRHHSDCTAREVQLLDHFPLLPDHGPMHIPLLTTMQRKWHFSLPTSQPGWTRSQRADLHQRWLHDPDFVTSLNTQIQSHISTLSPDHLLDTLQPLHNALNSIDHKQHTSYRHQQYGYATGPCKQLQWHIHQLRQHQQASLKSCFKSWFHVIKKSQIRGYLRQTATKIRKRRLEQVFQKAKQADEAHDHFRLYEAIRALAPKQQFRRVQLRSENGSPLDPEQSADALQAWFYDLYHDDGPQLSGVAALWPFAETELAQGLRDLPGSKALDPSCAPATCWKVAADDIAQIIQPCLHIWSSQARYPDAWSNGVLTFLPKPGRPGRQPSELRPIALLEPTGKATMGMIAKQILTEAQPVLQQMPQLAYLPQRGCTEAIQLMIQHCQQVRQLLHNNRYRVHRQAAGLAEPSLHGGVLLSLDLTKAFDMVPRQFLFAGLNLCGVSQPIIQMLMSIYQYTTFSFSHRGIQRQFVTRKGIRQGCKAAPILWCCFSAFLLQQIAEVLDWSWMISHILLYADDMTLYHAIKHQDEVASFLTAVGTVLDILEQFGMVVNMDKTHALCGLTGKQIHKFHKHWTKRTHHGLFLKIPRTDKPPTWIRIVSTIPYLGIVLSYNNFEMQTLRHRLRSGDKAQILLHRWLHCDTGLTTAQRTKIWKQCVLSCSQYGLFAVGMTNTGLQHYFRHCLKHLRRIYKEPVYITRVTHLEFLELHRLQHPLVHLHRIGLKMYKRAVNRLQNLAIHDILQHLDLDHLTQTLQQIYDLLHSCNDPLLNIYPPHFTCQICGQQFQTQQHLRRHLTIHHAQHGGQLRYATVLDTDHGLPTCIRCKQCFTTWTNFRYHVEYVCTVPIQSQDLVLANHEHRLRVADLLQLACSTDIQALTNNHQLCAYFNQCCVLCGMVCLSARSFLLHYDTCHSEIFQRHGPTHERLKANVNIQSPCELCGQTFQQQHQCTMLRQLAMLLTQHSMDTNTDDSQHNSLTITKCTWPCPHCHKVYTTKHGLKGHLDRYHRAMHATPSANDHPDALLHELIHQAVATADCASLLANEDILRVLSLRCMTCQVDFNRKNDFTRHLRTHHSRDRQQIDHEAQLLDRQFRTTQHCYCVPPPHNRHLCLPFLQYVMLRRQHVEQERRAEQARLTATDPVPDYRDDTEHPEVTLPNMMPLVFMPEHLPTQTQVTVKDLLQLILTFGQMDLLASSRQLRTELTLACQICTASFADPDSLVLHLQECHEDDWTASDRAWDALTWMVFKDNGCVCNPGTTWDTPGHQCVALRQAAMLHHRSGQQLLVPWAYKATDIVAVLQNLMTPNELLCTAMTLITRQFDLLAADETLRVLMQQTCLICRNDISMTGFADHYDTWHRVALGNGPALLRAQLDRTNWPMMADPDFAAHFSVLLAIPVWHRQVELTDTWPTVDQVLQQQHLRHLRMAQLIVPSSILEDANSFQIFSGLDMLDDPWLAPQLPYVCLLCQQHCFHPTAMTKHLLDKHGEFSFATQYAHDILIQIGRSPCYFCGLEWHSSEIKYRCVPVLNVATCLAHGLRRLPTGRPVEEPVDAGANPGHEGCADTHARRQESGHQETPWPGTHGREPASAELTTGHSDADQIGSQARGHDQHPAVGKAVPASPVGGAWLNFTRADSTESVLAPDGRQAHAAQTLFSQTHDLCPHPSDDHVDAVQTGLTSLARMSDTAHPGQCQQNAVPQMGRQQEILGANEGPEPQHGRGVEEPSRDIASTRRPLSHTEVSQLGQDSKGAHTDLQGPPVAVDSGVPNEPRTVAQLAQIVLSQHLATDPNSHQASAHGPVSIGTTVDQAVASRPLRAIRIVINSTGSMCYAISFLQGLFWLALCCQAADPSHWLCGYDLLDFMTILSPHPLDLCASGLLENLLSGEWTMQALNRQHDLLEFAEFMLKTMQPAFVSGAWAPLPMMTGDQMQDTHLQEEKGLEHTALRLSLTPDLSLVLHLQTLLDIWHDHLGLCRLLHKAAPGLCLAIDRSQAGNRKLTHSVMIPEVLEVPCFDPIKKGILKVTYRVVGLAIHLGDNPCAGHYRSALKATNGWFLYDDGQLPEKHDTLPKWTHSLVVFVWLQRQAEPP